jgi:hypothetical protein
MARLWARTIDFNTIAEGDTLPVLIKWETEETISRYAALHDDGNEGELLPESLPQQTVTGYVVELLTKGFPPESLEAEGSSLNVEHLQPVQANDTISLSGRVVGKKTADGLRLIECAVAVDNDRNEPVARARAVVSL